MKRKLWILSTKCTKSTLIWSLIISNLGIIQFTPLLVGLFLAFLRQNPWIASSTSSWIFFMRSEAEPQFRLWYGGDEQLGKWWPLPFNCFWLSFTFPLKFFAVFFIFFFFLANERWKRKRKVSYILPLDFCLIYNFMDLLFINYILIPKKYDFCQLGISICKLL